ncbi:Uncharacterised protein [Mycobacteroides abscessus subsp. abscessus]|nr:Uncharacterised protein [Mycobacteroides abscessus subsp. abscessus]
MRIRSAVAELPARVVTNDDIVGWIGEHSAGHFEGDLDAALRKVDYYLRYAGSPACATRTASTSSTPA